MSKHIIFDCDGTLVDTSSYQYKLFPFIKELLEELSSQHKLYVWTARGRVSTLRILAELGIQHFFQAISTPNDAEAKPEIEGIVDLVGSFPKESVCIIGDSSNDMLGAKNYGVLAIGAVWSREAQADILREFGADLIVNHPLDCSKLIQQKP